MDTKSDMTNSSEPAEGESTQLQLSVMIPARNEAALIRECLGSLVKQSEDDFLLGRDWELIVVDDGSTDATRQIATEFAGVTVLEAPPLADGWTGKTNALWFAAQQAGESGCCSRMRIRCTNRAICGAPSMKRSGIKLRCFPILRGKWCAACCSGR